MDTQEKWRPDQWQGDEGDFFPSLPPWEATRQMIEENFNFDPETATLTIQGETLPWDTRSTTILTIAYGCLRGLTVSETLDYFGKVGAAYCDFGESHPVRRLQYLEGMMSEHVSFPDGKNPLTPKTV